MYVLVVHRQTQKFPQPASSCRWQPYTNQLLFRKRPPFVKLILLFLFKQNTIVNLFYY